MKHSFTENECIDYMERAKKRVNGAFNAVDFLSDSADAVNMLFKDGDQYTFIHRSFQEYFTAYAVTHYFVKPLRQVLRKIPRRESDSVFSMARAMNPAVVDEFYLIPEYDDISADLSRVLKEIDPIDILILMEYRIEFGFYVESGKLSVNMYSVYSDSDLNAFVNIVCMMFKDGAHMEKIEGWDGIGIFSRLKKISAYISDNIDLKNENYVECFLDLKYMRIEIAHNSKKDVEFLEISHNWKEYIPFLGELSQSIKARCVFAKKNIDEVRRNYRRARDSADDILSM